MIAAWLLALGIGAGDAEAATPPTRETVRAEWDRYVRDFVQDDGRVIDRGRQDLSTSEGQAYALVRAVWCHDRGTFDKVLRWTHDNLQAGHPERLPAWKWGRRDDGSWGMLDEKAAADADQWMAWALLLAAERWKDATYGDRALSLLEAIWNEETKEIGGTRTMLPGKWATWNDPVQLNPSYWLPFAWRKFAEVDKARPWGRLVDDGYKLFEACRTPSGLQPDWCWVDGKSGKVVAPPKGQEATTVFGFEAFRVGWTLAAEVRWHDDARARSLMAPFAKLADGWAVETPIPAVIGPEGRPRETWGYLGLYGALLPVWALERPRRAEAIYLEEIRGARDAPPDPSHTRDYYAHNWVWFGLALWSGLATP